MRKKEYERPTMQVVELRVMNQLLAGSVSTMPPASFEDYQNGVFSWED